MSKLFLHKIILFFTIILFAQQVNAQWYNPDKVNKKAVEFYETAYQDATNGNYLNSITNLTEALKIDPNYLDAFLARADVYARVKNYAASASDYENIFSKDSLYAKSFLLQYATSLAGNGKFEKALENTKEL
jgi:Tfp pilus assembly protein PilF